LILTNEKEFKIMCGFAGIFVNKDIEKYLPEIEKMSNFESV
jgi:hypothetical protein